MSASIPASTKLWILIIDDSPTIRQYIRRILEESLESIEIVEAGNGRQALERLDEGQPIDLIFLDETMAGMRGQEFLDLSLGLLDAWNTGIIMLTSVNTLELRQKFKNEKLIRYLHKPSLKEDILKAAFELLRMTGSIERTAPAKIKD